MFQKIFFILVISLLSSFAFAAKKNVCSITLNSNEEIELFKSKLSAKEFNFTELTLVKAKAAKSEDGEEEDATAVNADWLMEGCRQQIKCDVLVISGHFGGTFFGKSGLQLPMEDLEKASCEDMCSGIIKNPKEVFLFGCNTLSGKEKDSRTPEQYMQVLINDGFTREQAQQVAAFRYSAFGSSFNDRMKRTFTGVPRIYGFTSIGPSGKTSAPFLKSYLNQTAPNYSEYISKAGPDLNKPLLTAFKNTAIAQSEGEKQGNSAVCYLGSSKVSAKDKLSYIDEVASKGGILQIAPHLVRFFNSFNLKDLAEADKIQFDKIKQNENGKKQVLGFTHDPVPGLIGPQVDVLNLALKFEWVDKAKYNEILSNIALKPLYSTGDYSTSVKDQICSINIKVSTLDYQKIKYEYWSNPSFISTLECLAVSMDEVVNIVKSTMYKKSNDSSYRSTAMSYFKSIILQKNTVNEIVDFQIKNIGDDSGKAQEVLDLLINNKHSDLGLAKKVYDLMTAANDPRNKAELFGIYFQLISGNEETVVKTLNYLFNSASPVWQFSDTITSSIRNVISSNENIKNKVAHYLVDKTNQKRIEKALWFIKTSNLKTANMQNSLMDLLKDNSIKTTAKLLILAHIKDNDVYSDFIRSNLIEVYKTSNSFQITQNILDILLNKMKEPEVYQSLFQTENRIVLKAKISQYYSNSENKGNWAYDQNAYKKEVKNLMSKISPSELNQQIKVLNTEGNSSDALALNGIMLDLKLEELSDYRSPDERIEILGDLSAASLTLLMDKKSNAVIRIENSTVCNFGARYRDYEQDCTELSSPGKDVYELRSLLYRTSQSVDVFHYDQKLQAIDFRISQYADLTNQVDKKITAGNPKYSEFFEDHSIDFVDLIKLTPTQYKIKFVYANNHRHGDNATLDVEAIVNFKASADGQQTYEIIKATAVKMNEDEGG